ncbi:MAG: hypothetical protein R2853_16620 [Thermomicrobiales bacterium]
MLAVRWISALTTLLVLLQAVLIGQALYMGEMSLVALHGWLGSGSFILALLLLGAAFLGVRSGELPRRVLLHGALVVLLMVAQLGLGYVGRRGGFPAAIHIPNGVLITALLSALMASTFHASRALAGRS